jgi:hypothetical protein
MQLKNVTHSKLVSPLTSNLTAASLTSLPLTPPPKLAAIFTYKELVKSKYGNPNEVTFATFLTALRNLLPPSKERSAAVRSVFETAAKDGRVNNLVLRRVQSALTSKELEEMFPTAISANGEVQLNLLPNEWRTNVNSSPRRVQKSPFGQRT